MLYILSTSSIFYDFQLVGKNNSDFWTSKDSFEHVPCCDADPGI